MYCFFNLVLYHLFFFPILNSLLDTLIEDQTIFLTSLKAKNCAELYNSDQRISGVYTIYPDDKAPFDVYCRLTENKTENRLRIVLRVKDTKLLVPRNTLYAEYAWLKIGDEEAKYQLNLGNRTSKPKALNQR